MFKRLIDLPKHPKKSFFLWGQRQTGKSTLLKAMYPDALWIDLLKSDEFRRYTDEPHLLRTEILPRSGKNLVVIDEVQKIPLLLDEAQWLIENKKTVLILCGSSARKLKRGQANLLGGRALRYELTGLVSAEIGDNWDLVRMINNGYLPPHYAIDNPWKSFEAYVGDYLKEEVASESLVRNLPAFSGFLPAAAISDTERINFSNIARECGVSVPTTQEYFQILVDTLLGRFLPAYVKRQKRRIVNAPKFYFCDVGIVNFLAKRKSLEPGNELFGKAFENWVYHELTACNLYTDASWDLSYWALSTGLEVDFIINDLECAIEAKASPKIGNDHLKGLRELKTEHPSVKRRIVVCLEKRTRLTSDGILILPVKEFTKRLWDGSLTSLKHDRG